MKITLVRHTKVNIPQGLIYGQTDVPLANTFEEEANDVISKLGNTAFDAIYTSPLSRCNKLAQKIAKGQTIISDDRLMEMNFGVWEGKLWNTVESTADAKAWFSNYLEIACPGGESYTMLVSRIRDFIFYLNTQNIGNCCVVTHGGPFRAFLSIANKIPANDIFKHDICYGQVAQIEVSFN